MSLAVASVYMWPISLIGAAGANFFAFSSAAGFSRTFRSRSSIVSGSV